MKFCVWRTGDKILLAKEKFISNSTLSNLISPVLRPFAFSPFRGQSIQSIKAIPMGA